jgi:hypothetical protein
LLEKGSAHEPVPLQHYSDNLTLTITDISRLEFRSALMKRVRIKEIKLEEAKEQLELFNNDTPMFNVVEVDVVVKNFAMQLLENLAHINSFSSKGCNRLFCRK